MEDEQIKAARKKLMRKAGATVQDIVSACGVCRQTAADFIKILKAADSIHIQSWKRDGKNRISTACYRAGPGEDAAKPGATPAMQRMREYRARLKKRKGEK
jgi:hypothetical protein